jgi:endonuclease IV
MPVMHRPYLIGAAVRSDDPATFHALAAMHERGEIDQIQLQVIPEPARIVRSRLDAYASTSALVYIHAPHHGQGVNPCAPSAFDRRDLQEIEEWIDSAMAITTEAADTLDAPRIVLHAGRYEDGRDVEAADGWERFLDRHFDERFILENLPAVHAGYRMLGSTAAELARLGGGRIRGYCLDFAHLYCTVNLLHRPYAAELGRFGDLPVRLFHLSNSERDAATDRHLELDHPEGGIDLDCVMGWLKAHPGIPTCLEFKHGDARVYARQLPVFDHLFRTRPAGPQP